MVGKGRGGYLIDEETWRLFEAGDGGEKKEGFVMIWRLALFRPVLTQVNTGDTGEVEDAEEIDVEGCGWWKLGIGIKSLVIILSYYRGLDWG